MAGMDSSIKVFFGGDTTQLKKSIQDAQNDVKGFQQGLGRSGRDFGDLAQFGKAFAAGIGLKVAYSALKDSVEEAQKLRDELEKAGKPVDDTTARVARLGDSLAEVAKIGSGFSKTFLGEITGLGEGLAGIVLELRGVSKEQQKEMDETSRAAIVAVQKLEEARKKAAEADSTEKRIALEKQLAELEQKSAIDRATGYAKVIQLEERREELQKSLSSFQQGTANYLKTEIDLLNNAKALDEARVKAAQELAESGLARIRLEGETSVTYNDKVNNLLAQQVEYSKLMGQLDKDSNEYRKADLEIRRIQIELGKLSKDQSEAAKLSAQDEYQFSLLKLKGTEHLTVQERYLYDLYVAESAEKKLQVQIQDLMSKGIENLTKGEREYLQALVKQDDKAKTLVQRKSDLLDSVSAQVDNEAAVTSEIEKQNELLAQQKKAVEDAESARRSFSGSGSPFMTQANLKDASDEELKALIAQQEKVVQSNINPALNPRSQTIGTDIAAAQAQAQVGAAKRELEFREQLRSDIKSFGLEYARSNFQGDPLRFDEVVQQIQNGTTETMKQTQILTDIKTGIKTLTDQGAYYGGGG